jgi:hypothetical protein
LRGGIASWITSGYDRELLSLRDSGNNNYKEKIRIRLFLRKRFSIYHFPYDRIRRSKWCTASVDQDHFRADERHCVEITRFLVLEKPNVLIKAFSFGTVIGWTDVSFSTAGWSIFNHTAWLEEHVTVPL